MTTAREWTNVALNVAPTGRGRRRQLRLSPTKWRTQFGGKSARLRSYITTSGISKNAAQVQIQTGISSFRRTAVRQLIAA